ncbi:MAG: glycyl-radical enzyme activating protein [Ruminococcaceae bacterium]|nr:glycyl-radical enzyme activating protein [Oscillospiraceae bacterium]
MQGRIFSIEEFSTFDGPGVRMTVFLKGCPLCCMWCHNPEGQAFEIEWVRSPNGCLECGACLAAGLHTKGTPSLVAESVAVCPRHLVRAAGEDIAAADLVARIEKKAAMLNAVGGGVTFSGGEPLAQPQFLAECLHLLRGKTHRAIQTAGFAEPQLFADILDECDFVLYDLKLMDSARHKQYTGVDNAVILENYRTLAKSDTPFITRIPLIPTVNDTAENITATARFMADLGMDRVELLPYNRAAGAKYALLSQQYSPTFDENAPPETHEDIFNEYGIGVTIL